MKISILGPECTGKTTLARELSEWHQSPWVVEAAREYLDSISRPYAFTDLLTIAKMQHQSEVAAEDTTAPHLFCDTDMTVLYIWSIDKFGKVEEGLLQLFKDVHYDLYLLCYPDIPWEADGLREDPHRRMELFEQYERVLQEKGVNYHVIRGDGEQRLHQAKLAIESA